MSDKPLHESIARLTNNLLDIYVEFIRLLSGKNLKTEYNYKSTSALWRLFITSWNIGHFPLISYELRDQILRRITPNLEGIKWPQRPQALAIRDLYKLVLSQGVEIERFRENIDISIYRTRWHLLSQFREISSMIVKYNINNYIEGLLCAFEASSKDQVSEALNLYMQALLIPQFYSLHNMSFLLSLTFYKNVFSIVKQYTFCLPLVLKRLFEGTANQTFSSLRDVYGKLGYRGRHGEKVRALLALLVGSSCLMVQGNKKRIKLSALLNALSLMYLRSLLHNGTIGEDDLFNAFIDCMLCHIPISYISEQYSEQSTSLIYCVTKYVEDVIKLIAKQYSEESSVDIVENIFINECIFIQKLAKKIVGSEQVVNNIIDKWVKKYRGKVVDSIPSKIAMLLLRWFALNNILQVGYKVPLTSEEYSDMIFAKDYPLCGLLDKPFVAELQLRVMREAVSLDIPFILVQRPDALYAVAYVYT